MQSKLLAFVAVLSAMAPAAWQVRSQEAKTAPTVGAQAPSLRVNDQDGHAVSIGGKSDHWTLLAFYPKAATPG